MVISFFNLKQIYEVKKFKYINFKNSENEEIKAKYKIKIILHFSFSF